MVRSALLALAGLLGGLLVPWALALLLVPDAAYEAVLAIMVPAGIAGAVALPLLLRRR